MDFNIHIFRAQHQGEFRFVCLAMTDAYIDKQFDAIKAHASDLEDRLDDSYCTARWLKAENHKYGEGFQRAGEQVSWIEEDYGEAIARLNVVL